MLARCLPTSFTVMMLARPSNRIWLGVSFHRFEEKELSFGTCPYSVENLRERDRDPRCPGKAIAGRWGIQYSCRVIVQQICCLLISKDSMRRPVASRCKWEITTWGPTTTYCRFGTILRFFQTLYQIHFFFCACGSLLRLDIYLKLVRLLPSTACNPSKSETSRIRSTS
jgi:hypothetical protein